MRILLIVLLSLSLAIVSLGNPFRDHPSREPSRPSRGYTPSHESDTKSVMLHEREKSLDSFFHKIDMDADTDQDADSFLDLFLQGRYGASKSSESPAKSSTKSDKSSTKSSTKSDKSSTKSSAKSKGAQYSHPPGPKAPEVPKQEPEAVPAPPRRQPYVSEPSYHAEKPRPAEKVAPRAPEPSYHAEKPRPAEKPQASEPSYSPVRHSEPEHTKYRPTHDEDSEPSSEVHGKPSRRPSDFYYRPHEEKPIEETKPKPAKSGYGYKGAKGPSGRAPSEDDDDEMSGSVGGKGSVSGGKGGNGAVSGGKGGNGAVSGGKGGNGGKGGRGRVRIIPVPPGVTVPPAVQAASFSGKKRE